MSVQDTAPFPFLRELKRQIREVVRRGIPYLGICLGGQLLAEVLGGKVHVQKCGERGCHEISLTEQGERDPMFSGMPKRFTSFQWHGDSFDLPPGAVHLARTETCPFQAFRWGERAYGIQFHPEVTTEIVSVWSSATDDELMSVLDTFKAAEKVYRSTSVMLLSNFLTMI
jgi:GMP synthase (glutamine-hydrolysing)